MTTDTIGGVWTYALELARMLSTEGIAVGLATMGAPLTAEQREEALRITNLALFESAYQLEWMDNPWDDLGRAGEWLLELESRFEPDLLHLNSYMQGALPFHAPKLVVGHSCVLSWWQAVKGEAAPSAWNRYRLEVTKGLQAADLVIAPSQSMLAALRRYYGPLPAAVAIPNARDPIAYAPLTKKEFVFVAGRLWDEAKNVAALVEVAPDLPWPVYVAGGVQHPICDKQPPLEHVSLLGQLSSAALVPWFGHAAIYALPARYEPFGLSVLEAALAGCALVLGDIPSLRENWNEAAFLVRPDDRCALRATLAKLMTTPALREEFGQRARNRALEFTPERMRGGYLSAYSDLMLTETTERPELAANMA